jgi:hypothetical protein
MCFECKIVSEGMETNAKWLYAILGNWLEWSQTMLNQFCMNKYNFMCNLEPLMRQRVSKKELNNWMWSGVENFPPSCHALYLVYLVATTTLPSWLWVKRYDFIMKIEIYHHLKWVLNKVTWKYNIIEQKVTTEWKITMEWKMVLSIGAVECK